MEKLFSLIEAPFIWLSGLAAHREKATTLPHGCHPIGHSLLDSTLGEPVGLPLSALEKHAYLLGSTGSGKTNLILKLIEQDIERGHSVAIFDLRGDLVERVLSLCVKKDVHSHRVLLFDLREKQRVVGFNPLGGDGEPFVRALHLLEVIRAESEGWGVQLEETMRNCFLLLAHAEQPLTGLEQVLFDEDYLDALLSHCDDPSVVGFFERYKSLSEEKQLTWALPVMNKVTPLFATPGLRAVFGAETSIALDTMLAAKGSILLVSLAVDELSRSGRMLGSLLVAAITRTMLARVNIPEVRRNPVRLYIDEFENMASESFMELIAEGRRFKLSLLLSHQNLSQLTPRLLSTIRNNVGLQILFRCGFQDAKQLVSELPDGFDLESLLGLQTGEMFLMPRGAEANQVRCALMDTTVKTDDLALYREEILRDTGTPIDEVLGALKARRMTGATIESLQRPWGLGESE